MSALNRRDFLRVSAFGLAVTANGGLGFTPPTRARVSLVKKGGRSREQAIREAVDLLGAPAVPDAWVAVKPNFNSADPFPGSTHNDTLAAVVRLAKDLGARQVTVADRSGMGGRGGTRHVMEAKGVFALGEEVGFDVMALSELPSEGWAHITHPDLHWSRGFHFARLFQEVDAVFQTSCLKTHRFGGHFTLSLKNTVGMVARNVPGIDHNFMREMHDSVHHRRMIAEMNLAYEPTLLVLDGVDCFTDGGPDKGTLAHPDVIMAATDRVALDAVGVAVLRELGTTREVADGPIFALEQIARAVELGLGVDAPEGIDMLTGDPESRRYADTLRSVLMA